MGMGKHNKTKPTQQVTSKIVDDVGILRSVSKQVGEQRSRHPRRRTPFFSLAFIAISLSAALYYHFGQSPFAAIPSGSMVPTFHVGDLVRIKPIVTSQVKKGDIVVVELPRAIQVQYNYPASIVHRVASVNRSGGVLSFRTKGDANANEDPYTVESSQVKGQVVQDIRYLGFPVIFFRSEQGKILAMSLIVIYVLYLFSGYLDRSRGRLRNGLATLINGDVLDRLEHMDLRQDSTLQEVRTSLRLFSVAMNEYATHLQSHTASVQGMAESANALRRAAELQTDMLEAMLAMGKGKVLMPVVLAAAKPASTAAPLITTPGPRVRGVDDSSRRGEDLKLSSQYLLPDMNVESAVLRLQQIQKRLTGD